MTEETLVGGDADGGALDLATVGLAAQLPDHLAHLGDRLRGDRLAEAREPAARVHRDAAADRGRARAQQRLGLALAAQPDVLVPVELERGGEVVDLGQAQVVGPDAGFLVRAPRDRVAEAAVGRGHARRSSRWRSRAARARVCG